MFIIRLKRGKVEWFKGRDVGRWEGGDD